MEPLRNVPNRVRLCVAWHGRSHAPTGIRINQVAVYIEPSSTICATGFESYSVMALRYSSVGKDLQETTDRPVPQPAHPVTGAASWATTSRLNLGFTQFNNDSIETELQVTENFELHGNRLKALVAHCRDSSYFDYRIRSDFGRPRVYHM